MFENLFSQTPRLVLDMDNTPSLPANFRILPDLASASGQFSIKSLQLIKQTLPQEKKLVFVDLREESHGFVNELAVCWYGNKNRANLSKSTSEIAEDEKTRLEALCEERRAAIYFKKPPVADTPFAVSVTSISTESDLMDSENLHYIRIPVTDHEAPRTDAVDRFVQCVKETSSDMWLHIHCRKGRGRSSTMLSLLDMMKHAKHDSFELIMKRNLQIGGSDLLFIPHPNEPKYEQKLERKLFLEQFYTYCLTSDAQFSTSWSEFLVDHNR